MDFMSDQLFDGRSTSQPRGREVVETLEWVTRPHVEPKIISVDNGPEFIAKEFDLWAYLHGVTLDFSRPAKPTHNAFIESFNWSFRTERLNASWFMSLDEAPSRARLGGPITMRSAHTARSATRPRSSWQTAQGRHPGPEPREPGSSQPRWSKIGGMSNRQCTNIQTEPVAGAGHKSVNLRPDSLVEDSNNADKELWSVLGTRACELRISRSSWLSKGCAFYVQDWRPGRFSRTARNLCSLWQGSEHYLRGASGKWWEGSL